MEILLRKFEYSRRRKVAMLRNEAVQPGCKGADLNNRLKDFLIQAKVRKLHIRVGLGLLTLLTALFGVLQFMLIMLARGALFTATFGVQIRSTAAPGC